MVNKEAGDRIRFRLSLADQVGAAFHQNAIPVLNELQDLKLEIRSEPPFTMAANWRMDELADRKSIRVVNPDVQLDAGYLNKLTEERRQGQKRSVRNDAKLRRLCDDCGFG